MLVLAGGVAGATCLRSYDLFWHLAAGRLILEGGGVPRVDPFSFSAAGTPWVDHSWLFQILVWRLWEAAGTWGAWSLKLVLGASIAALLVHHLARWRVPALGTTLLVLLALGGAAFRFTARPEMITLLFAAWVAHTLCPVPTGPRRRRTIPLLAVLVVSAAVWANIHAGAILAPLMVAAALGGGWVGGLLGHRRLPPDPGGLGSLALALPLTLGGLLLNPYGALLLGVPVRLTRIVGQPWAANLEWTWPAPRDFPLLYLSVAGLLVACLIRRDRIEPVSLALGLMGAALGLRYVRNVGLFFVLLPFAAAPLLGGERAVPRARTWIAAVLASAGLAWLALAPPAGCLGPGLEPGRFPVEACDFVEREGLDGRLFNEVAFGGFLVWRFPDRPVFIDGRNEVYTDLLQQIHGGLQDLPLFWELTRRWEIQAAMLRYPPSGQGVVYREAGGGERIVRRAWSELYFPRQDWALVHWDDTAMVRVRRDAVDPAWLARHEYRHLNPDDWPFLEQELLAGKRDAAGLMADLRRKLEQDPGCRRALELQAALRSALQARSGAPPAGPPGRGLGG